MKRLLTILLLSVSVAAQAQQWYVMSDTNGNWLDPITLVRPGNSNQLSAWLTLAGFSGGGPTNGVSAAVATNIAAVQAQLATNFMWTNVTLYVGNFTNFPTAVITNLFFTNGTGQNLVVSNLTVLGTQTYNNAAFTNLNVLGYLNVAGATTNNGLAVFNNAVLLNGNANITGGLVVFGLTTLDNILNLSAQPITQVSSIGFSGPIVLTNALGGIGSGGLFADTNGNVFLSPMNAASPVINYQPKFFGWGFTNVFGTGYIATATNLGAIAFSSSGVQVYQMSGVTAGQNVTFSLFDPTNSNVGLGTDFGTSLGAGLHKGMKVFGSGGIAKLLGLPGVPADPGVGNETVFGVENFESNIVVNPGVLSGAIPYTRGDPTGNGPGAELGPMRTTFQNATATFPVFVTNSMANLYQRWIGLDRLYSVLNGWTNNNTVNIVGTGTSKMYGSYLGNPSNCIPQQLQNSLTAMGFSVNAVNRGVPGADSEMWRTNYLSGDLGYFSGTNNLMVAMWGYNNNSGRITNGWTYTNFMNSMSNCLYTTRQTWPVDKLSIILLTDQGSWTYTNHSQIDFVENTEIPVYKQLCDQFQCAMFDSGSMFNDSDHANNPWMDSCCGGNASNHVHQLDSVDLQITAELLSKLAPETYRSLVIPPLIQGRAVGVSGPSGLHLPNSLVMQWANPYKAFLDSSVDAAGTMFTNLFIRTWNTFIGSGPGGVNVQMSHNGSGYFPGSVAGYGLPDMNITNATLLFEYLAGGTGGLEAYGPDGVNPTNLTLIGKTVLISPGGLGTYSSSIGLTGITNTVPIYGTGFAVTHGTNKRSGTAVLSGGTVVVANTTIAAGDYAILSYVTTGTQIGILSAPLSLMTNGSAFVINSSYTNTLTETGDTNIVAWLLYNQN